MDKHIAQVIPETAFERFLLMKLREQEEINEQLSLLIKNGVQLSPKDIVVYEEMKNIVHKMVHEAQMEDSIHHYLTALSHLFR